MSHTIGNIFVKNLVVAAVKVLVWSGFVWFLKQLPDKLPSPGNGAGTKLVHLLLLLLLVPGQVLLHPVELVLAAGLQVKVV